MSEHKKSKLFLDEFHNIKGIDSETYKKMGSTYKIKKINLGLFDVEDVIESKHSQEGVIHVAEAISTGQMIDCLEVGQVAERVFEPIGTCSDRYTHIKLDEFDRDLMFYCEQEECWEYERLTGNMIRSRWIIRGSDPL